MRQIRKYQKDKGRILDSNKLLYHSLPIGCILALLLLGSICINPLGFGSNGSDDKVYAADPSPEPQPDGSTNNISLSIDGNSSNDSYSKSLNAVTNQTNYIAYNVVATASNIESYSLSIKYTDGSTSLKNSTAGATTINPVASTGVQGKSMTSNTWGWGWSDNTSTANGDMTYRPMQTSDSVIKSANASSANVNGKIVFAANFGEGATAGSYSTNALLSFAIQPKAVTGLTALTYMQDMTSDVCAASSVGDSKKLVDNRSNSTSYTVTKFKDNKCWMAENLKLGATSTTTALTPNDSDVTANWTMPALTTASAPVWGTNSNPSSLSNSWFNINGATTTSGYLYSWCMATANSCTTLPVKTDGTYQQAPSSICPKGWALPSTTDYQNLLTAAGATSSNGKSILMASPYNFVVTGYVVGSNTIPNSTGGYYSTSESSYTYYSAMNSYQTRATQDNANYVSRLEITDTYTNVIGAPFGWGSGTAVRCIAR